MVLAFVYCKLAGLRPPAPPKTDTDMSGQRARAGRVRALENKDASTVSQQDTTGYVTQLQKRIEEKDDQIRFLRER